ncbi:MAG: hypothetical protein ACRBCT_05795 [Alphaproteobacteria bacterium]
MLLRLSKLSGVLFGLSISQFKADISPKIEAYKSEQSTANQQAVEAELEKVSKKDRYEAAMHVNGQIGIARNQRNSVGYPVLKKTALETALQSIEHIAEDSDKFEASMRVAKAVRDFRYRISTNSATELNDLRDRSVEQARDAIHWEPEAREFNAASQIFSLAKGVKNIEMGSEAVFVMLNAIEAGSACHGTHGDPLSRAKAASLVWQKVEDASLNHFKLPDDVNYPVAEMAIRTALEEGADLKKIGFVNVGLWVFENLETNDPLLTKLTDSLNKALAEYEAETSAMKKNPVFVEGYRKAFALKYPDQGDKPALQQ